MYIKVVTVKAKVKGKREKKVYRYVRVIESGLSFEGCRSNEKVIATLGTLSRVRDSRLILACGLKDLPAD